MLAGRIGVAPRIQNRSQHAFQSSRLVWRRGHLPFVRLPAGRRAALWVCGQWSYRRRHQMVVPAAGLEKGGFVRCYHAGPCIDNEHAATPAAGQEFPRSPGRRDAAAIHDPCGGEVATGAGIPKGDEVAARGGHGDHPAARIEADAATILLHRAQDMRRPLQGAQVAVATSCWLRTLPAMQGNKRHEIADGALILHGNCNRIVVANGKMADAQLMQHTTESNLLQ